MAVDFEKLAKQVKEGQWQAKHSAETARLSSLSAAIVHRQSGQITEEQYQELAGQSYVETMRDQFTHELEGAKHRLQTKVDAGYLAPAEFTAICEKCFQTKEEM